MSRARLQVSVGAVVIAVGLAGASLAGVPQAAASGPTGSAPGAAVEAKAPARHVAKHGLTDQALQRVVEKARAGGKVAPGLARISAGRVRVEVVGRSGPATVRAVRAVGGRVLGQIRTLVLADIPLDRIQGLERRPAIQFVRLPQRVDEPVRVPETGTAASPAAKTGPRGGDILGKTNVASWHAAGYTGAGIKIGIIDGFKLSTWQSSVAAGEIVAMPAGTFCRNNGADCSATFWNSSEHGVAVAEILSDMAPGATLYAASATTVTDLRAAVDYFKSQGVRIITRSQTARYDGAGNGTGPMADVMAYAVSLGIAWFNSAGNSAGNGTTDIGSYFRQAWWDPNANGWMDFGTVGNEYLAFTCQGYLINGLRWSDWAPTGRTDYDIEIYEEQNDATKISQSTGDQGGGALPLETALGCTSGSDLDYMSVRLYSAGAGTTGDVLEFMTNDAEVELASTPWSATGPAADTNTPGTASIGAVDPVGGTSIASYSSQGPTNDNRIKPDLSGPAGMASLSWPSGTFSGTSAATPVVAGAAASVLSANPGATPAQLVDAMRGAVVDRGNPGPDNTFGTGELTLPAPPAPPPPPAATVAVTSAIVVPVINTLKNKFPVQVRWQVNGSQAQATVWRSLNGGSYQQGAATGSKRKVRVKMVMGKSNRFAIRAVDGAGAASEWYYTRAFKPRVIDDKDSKVKYASGWRHFRHPGAWKGTLSSSQGARGSVRLKFKGSAVSMAVFRSANSGKVRIYIDGKPKVKLNLRSNKVQARRVVLNYAFATRGRHTIEVEPLTSGPKGLVFLDGFVVLG